MSERYDAIVVGAGIGGLSAAVLLAQSGRRTLVVEKDDRVGGRAMSVRGEEISDRGVNWYYDLLSRQFSYLADSRPSINKIVGKRMLDGYVLDLGYHGVSCAGEGYFARLRDLMGGYGNHPVKINPCLTGTWYKGEFYEEPPFHSMRLDDKIYAEMKRLGLKFMDFFGDLSRMTPEYLEEMDKVSLHDHLVKTGFAQSDVIYEYWHCTGTLITTINNPHEISVGDIFRYTAQVIAPMIVNQKEGFVGGFTENGVMEWPQSVADRFVEYGGEVRLNTWMSRINIEGGKVTGITVVGGEEEETLSAGIVIFSGPIQGLFNYTDEEAFPADFVSRVRSLYGYGSLSPYMGLSDLVVPDEHARRLMKTPCVLSKEDGFDWDVYMAWNIQSYIEPSCAPEGKHLFAAYLPLTEKDALNKELVIKLVDTIPEFLESIYPGFKDTIEWELFPVCTKLEGVAKSVSQAGSLKPDVRAPGVEGLFFAGDTARGYGVAMDCACSSGILCASAVTGEDYGVQ